MFANTQITLENTFLKFRRICQVKYVMEVTSRAFDRTYKALSKWSDQLLVLNIMIIPGLHFGPHDYLDQLYPLKFSSCVAGNHPHDECQHARRFLTFLLLVIAQVVSFAMEILKQVVGTAIVALRLTWQSPPEVRVIRQALQDQKSPRIGRSLH